MRSGIFVHPRRCGHTCLISVSRIVPRRAHVPCKLCASAKLEFDGFRNAIALSPLPLARGVYCIAVALA